MKTQFSRLSICSKLVLTIEDNAEAEDILLLTLLHSLQRQQTFRVIDSSAHFQAFHKADGMGV